MNKIVYYFNIFYSVHGARYHANIFKNMTSRYSGSSNLLLPAKRQKINKLFNVISVGTKRAFIDKVYIWEIKKKGRIHFHTCTVQARLYIASAEAKLASLHLLVNREWIFDSQSYGPRSNSILSLLAYILCGRNVRLYL